MVKNSIEIVIILLITVKGFACSLEQESFCAALEINGSDIVVSGTIISVDDDGIDLEIIEVLRGEESRNVIRIWDGTDFLWCMDEIFSMASSTIGEVNDTVIILLPKIAEIQNSWDVIGDYRRPSFFHYEKELKVVNGFANGFILGPHIAPIEYHLRTIEYVKLADLITTNGNCGDLTLSSHELNIEDNVKYTNPVTSEINIELGELQTVTNINVYSYFGRNVRSISIDNQESINIPFDNEPPGLYILEIITSKRRSRRFKIIKS